MCHLVPLDFWCKARVELDAIKPLFWLGETQDVPYLAVFDCLYAWRWMSATEHFYRQEAARQQLLDVLNHYEFDCPPGTFPVFFTTNHDENTWNGTEYEKYGSMAAPLAVFSCTWNGVPLVYTGQELPLHKRLPFFDKDQIEWKEKPELHVFYKTLLELRKQHPALQAGTVAKPQLLPVNLTYNPDSTVLAFLRKNQDREVLVILNFTGNDVNLQLTGNTVKGNFRNVFTNEQVAVNSTTQIALKGWDYKVLVTA
jgi:glycosidase